ncbi:MAG: exodeoxyribonuclease VII small subunit [Ignavibacteriae bacterium HGW-Ignavibacteriae-2]|jgi:exodeoxyribonuclease VII small subunit|nr:MAG: exodeoxyribonuclease VII small subunit [Ignavibacteriae bacterium HGW-Ignavibacteriae-2]
MTKKREKFEDLLKRLQEISDQLESEDIGLDDSIQLYEEGIKLSELCHKKLKEAELKITELKSELGKELEN